MNQIYVVQVFFVQWLVSFIPNVTKDGANIFWDFEQCVNLVKLNKITYYNIKIR